MEIASKLDLSPHRHHQGRVHWTERNALYRLACIYQLSGWETHRKSFEERERRIQIGISLEVFSLSASKTLTLRRVIREAKDTDRASLNKSGSNAHNRDEKNTAGVIVVFVERPEN